MQEFIDNFVKYGYILLFIYSLGGGMLALLAMGVFSSSHDIDATFSIATAFVANFIGSMFMFYLCKISKKDFQKHLDKHRRKIALLVILFRKNGFIFTLIFKFIYGLKSLAPIAAELAKMPVIRYAIYNLFSSLIWAIAVFYVAFFFGEQVKFILSEYKEYGIAALILLVIFIIFYFKKVGKKC